MINNDTKIAIIGLGYVGLPLALAFAKQNINIITFLILALLQYIYISLT